MNPCSETRGIEALQSCFPRSGLPGMTTEVRNPGLPFSPSGEARSVQVANHQIRDTKHGFSRDMHHGLYRHAVRRGCDRFAQPTAAARAAAPVAQSLLSCSLLFAIVHYCSLLFTKKYCPEPVSACRLPFSAVLTTSVVRRGSRRPPGCCRCGNRKMDPS